MKKAYSLQDLVPADKSAFRPTRIMYRLKSVCAWMSRRSFAAIHSLITCSEESSSPASSAPRATRPLCLATYSVISNWLSPTSQKAGSTLCRASSNITAPRRAWQTRTSTSAVTAAYCAMPRGASSSRLLPNIWYSSSRISSKFN